MLSLYQCEFTLDAQIRAQELNEHGVFCIEVGQYERAITALIEALQVAESTNLDPRLACCCHACSLESCMKYSQVHSSAVTNDGTKSKKSRITYCSAPDGYVYRQPIRIPPEAVHGRHTMGMTLPLLLTFNLALAYHLNAISARLSGTKVHRSHLQKILQLYELAYRWQSEQEQGIASLTGRSSSNFSSLKFTMIIANNLGQIHRMVNNMTKYRLCMQHLLSTMMFIVDCQQLNDVISTEPLRHFIDLDGFLRNTSCLFLKEQAAAAA